MGLFLFLVLSYVLMSGSCLFGPYLLFLLFLSFIALSMTWTGVDSHICRGHD